MARQPNGTLDLVIANADVLVAPGGKGVIELKGYAAFSISPLTGFRLSGFKVSDFTLFPTSLPTDVHGRLDRRRHGQPTSPVPTQFPVAHLASPLQRRHHHRDRLPRRQRPGVRWPGMRPWSPSPTPTRSG